jgi:hypothetical protein
MHNQLISVVRIAVASIAIFIPHVAVAQPQTYVAIRLPKNVSIELPRNWVVISNNQRITLDAAVIAREYLQQQKAVADFRSDLAFAANYYDDDGKTAGIVNVRYYPDRSVTQSEIRSISADGIRQIDLALQGEVQRGIVTSGNRLLAWQGTSKQEINNSVALVSDYRRSSENGAFRVRLIRVLDAGQSFTLTISYREDQANFLQPISDRVIKSLRR